MFKFASLLGAALLATRVAGHGAVTSYVIDGTAYPGYTGFSPASSPATIEWQWPDYNPTLDPSLPKVMCNGGTSAGLTASVSPGSSITATWAQWTHAQGSVSVYLYKCSGAFSACTGSGAGWFKIDEAGLLSGTMYNGVWGLQQVIDHNTWTSKIPAGIAPGNYLIRHELIAVHQTNTPQFYAECAQLVIGGSGTSSPSGGYLVAIPGYCKLSDANVSLDIYGEAAKTATSWDVPGPPVWGGAGSPVAQTVAPATATAATAPTTTAAGSGSSSSGGTVPLYGQCGGANYTGSTTCASGTCTKNGDYYSQCTP